MDQIVLEPEPKMLDAWSWNPIFEFRLHSPSDNGISPYNKSVLYTV